MKFTPLNAVSDFKKAMDGLISSKYVLSDKHISEVFRVITSSKVLFELFQYVTEGFDFDEYLNVCFSVTPDGKGYFTPPKKEEDFLALVFLILKEADSKNLDLLELADKFFPSGGGKQASYGVFVTEVFIPFEDATERAVLKILNAKIEGEIEAFDNVASDEEIMPKESDKGENSDNAVTDKAVDYIEKTKGVVSSFKIDENTKDEAKYILDALIDGLKENDMQKVSVCLSALDYMKKSVRKFKLDMDGLTMAIGEVIND